MYVYYVFILHESGEHDVASPCTSTMYIGHHTCTSSLHILYSLITPLQRIRTYAHLPLPSLVYLHGPIWYNAIHYMAPYGIMQYTTCSLTGSQSEAGLWSIHGPLWYNAIHYMAPYGTMQYTAWSLTGSRSEAGLWSIHGPIWYNAIHYMAPYGIIQYNTLPHMVQCNTLHDA